MMLLRDIVIRLFFCLCLIGCAHKDEAITVSDAHRIPLSIENGLIVLRYTLRPLGDTLLIQLKRFVKEGTHYEQQTQYMKGEPLSVTLYEIAPGTFKFVKSYGYQAGEKVPVILLDQYNIDRGGHKGYELVSHTLKPDLKTLRQTFREIFDKDTVFRWNGANIASQKFYLESEEEIISRLTPFSNEKKTGRGFGLYSEGIGNTYLKVIQDQIVIEMSLIDIEYPEGK